MKTRIALTVVLLFAATGCSTQRSVSQMQGRGTTQMYDAPFDAAWRASIDAAQIGDLRILNADKSQGYISARRSLRPETFGENVGIWVRPVSPAQTEVEVVSRQAGPPKLVLKNWEKDIQRTIAANLTRESMGGTGTGIQR